jgi:hypothetical protein
VTAPRSQQAPPPVVTPPPIVRSRPRGDQGSEAPCKRCQGIPGQALQKLRAALEAKEAHR